MKSATLPSLRVEPELREAAESVLQEGETLFDPALAQGAERVVLGQASVLAEQPEFQSGESMRRLLALTDNGEHLGELLRGAVQPRASPSPSATSTATRASRTSPS